MVSFPLKPVVGCIYPRSYPLRSGLCGNVGDWVAGSYARDEWCQLISILRVPIRFGQLFLRLGSVALQSCPPRPRSHP